MSLSKHLVAALYERCQDSEKRFRNIGEYNQDKKYIFKDNGANILAVAHLDTVGKTLPSYDNKTNNFYAMQLDDRLGAWGIVDVLPRLCKKPFDILLTTNEEKGESTAKDFQPPEGKKYNWVFSLDRSGVDVVTYQYRSDNWQKLLKEQGFEVAWGSYSCIRELEHLKCCGVNFGIGYYKQHSKDCYCNLKVVQNRLWKVSRFIDNISNQEFPHVPTGYSRKGYTRYGGYGHGYYDDYDYYRPSTNGYSTIVNMPKCCNRSMYSDWTYCPYCGTKVIKVKLID